MALPTINWDLAGTIDYVALNYETDVAGQIEAGLAGTATTVITVTFGYTYTVAPIVVLTSASLAATQVNYYYLSGSTTTTFSITLNNDIDAGGVVLINYHVFETQ